MKEWFFLSFFIGVVCAFFLPKKVKHTLTQTLSFYITYVGLPILIYTSIQKTTIQSSLWIIATVLTTILFFIGYVIFVREKNKQISPAAFFCATVPNIAYIGIPFAYLFFKDEEVLVATTLSIIIPILHLTLGLFLAKKIQQQKTGATIKTPLLWMILLATVASQLFLYETPLFSFITESTLYLIPFIVGILFVFGRVHWLYVKAALVKFLVSPLLFLLGAFVFEQNILLYVFLGALPPGLTNSILAEQLGYDAKGSAVFISYATAAFLFFVWIVSFFA